MSKKTLGRRTSALARQEKKGGKVVPRQVQLDFGVLLNQPSDPGRFPPGLFFTTFLITRDVNFLTLPPGGYTDGAGFTLRTGFGDNDIDNFVLHFRTRDFRGSDNVRVTCIEGHPDLPAEITCAKWTIEASNDVDTGGAVDPGDPNKPIGHGIGAVAHLRNWSDDKDVGHFVMPFKITACLKEFFDASTCVP